MSLLFEMPWTQAFDGSGNTLGGAKLYFYAAGTSTPINIYSDAGLSVALPNPVVADAGGRFAPIYLNEGISYKVALFSADETLIWTADNIENQNTQADVETLLSAMNQTIESAGYTSEEAQNPDNFPKAVYKYTNAANYYTDLGTTANVYVLEGQDDYARPNDYFAGQQVNFVTTRANTSQTISVNVEGLGAKSVFRYDGTNVNVGEFYGLIKLIYNGTFFVFPNDSNGKIGDIKASVLDVNHNEWYLCNGQELSRTDFAELYALIGTNFGVGDSATTFNLPDYRGKFLRGLGGNSAADIYTTQAEGLPNITGKANFVRSEGHPMVQDPDGAFYDGGTSGSYEGSDAYAADTADVLNFDASRANTIYGASNHVTPINHAVNYFIKVR